MANILSEADINDLMSDIREIVEDTSINTSILYRQYVGEDYYQPQEQLHTKNIYTDWSGVSAIIGLVTLNEVNKVGNIQVGDTKFVFMRSDVSGAVSTTDLIVNSGATYGIIKLGYDPLNVVNICYGRKGSD